MTEIHISFMDRVRYRLHKLSESSDNIKTWTTVLIGLLLISLYFQNWIFFSISVIFILFLISERDVKSGRVTEYLRKNKDIPNRTQIKNMKEEYINKQEVK